MGIFAFGSAQAQAEAPTATRTLPMTAMLGDTVMVTIEIENMDNRGGVAFASVKEIIPSGFSFTDPNDPNVDVDSDGTPTFTTFGSATSASISYEVTAMTTGVQEFMGTMTTSDPSAPEAILHVNTPSKARPR